MKSVRIFLALVIGASVILTVTLKPGLIRFWPFSATEFVQLLTPLVLVSLFIERAQEVFLTAWRGKEASKKSREVQLYKERLAKGGMGAQDDLERAQNTLTDYKSETQQIAFVTGLILGIVVSALGIRGLELFVDPAVLADLSPTQKGIFNAADVLLTGALLGGGSDALHKMISVFTNFMDTSAKRAKGEGV